MTRSGVVSSLSSVLPTSQVLTSGYVNMETILHFFYKITNERGTKTVFTYAHVKWFYGQSERAYYLNYFIQLYLLHSVMTTARLKSIFNSCLMVYLGNYHQNNSTDHIEWLALSLPRSDCLFSSPAATNMLDQDKLFFISLSILIIFLLHNV